MEFSVRPQIDFVRRCRDEALYFLGHRYVRGTYISPRIPGPVALRLHATSGKHTKKYYHNTKYEIKKEINIHLFSSYDNVYVGGWVLFT